MSESLVKVVPTPNPDALMFRVFETLVSSGTYEYTKEDNTIDSPLAERILSLDNVELILIAPRFITVRKSSESDWSPLTSRISQRIVSFLNSGEMAVIEKDQQQGKDPASEIERRIMFVLDEEVRPAIAQDGGDVIFHGYNDGIVTLELIGACGTCPSSTATLQYGIQNLLIEEIPEVHAVESI